MPRVLINKAAPNFSLIDADGNDFNLTDFQAKKNVLLVFNRGFI